MGGRVSQPMGEKTGFPRRIPGSDVGVTPTLRAAAPTDALPERTS